MTNNESRWPGWLPSAPVTVTGLGILIIGIVFAFRMGQSRPASLSPEDELTQATSDEHRTRRAAQELLAQEQDIAFNRRAELLAHEGRVTSLLNELESEVQNWSAAEALQEHDEGRWIATNPELVRRYLAILSSRRATSADVSNYRDLVTRTVRATKRAHAEAGSMFVPSQQLAEDLARYQNDIQSDLSVYEEHRAAIAALVRTGKDSGVPLAEESLATAIQNERHAASLEESRIIEQLQDVAYKDAARIKGEAEAEKIRRLAELDAQRTRDSIEDAQQTRREEEVDQLRELAKSEAVRAKYAPFLTPSRKRYDFLKNETPQPCSYRKLQRYGAFEDYKAFARAGAGRNPRNGSRRGNHDRPSWPYPQTEEEFAVYKPLFEEFKRLAPYWIEQGYLLP